MTSVGWVNPVAVEYPGCPAEYHASTSAMVLCVMWVELAELENAVGTIPQNGQIAVYNIMCFFLLKIGQKSNIL